MKRPHYNMGARESIAWFWNNCSEDRLIVPELGPCRVFTEPLDDHGYPRVRIKGNYVRLHREVLKLKLGRPPVPCALHHCDVRSCFRPQHLYEGTPDDNTDDRVERDRGYRPLGVLNPFAKLTEEEVKTIRKLLAQGENVIDLSLQFQVRPMTIYHIKNRKTWRHI